MPRPHRTATALLTVLVLATSATACRPTTGSRPAGNGSGESGDFVSGRVAQLNICGTDKCPDRVKEMARIIGGNRPEVIALEEACNSEVEAAAKILKDDYHLSYHIVRGPTGTLSSIYRCKDTGSFGNYILTADAATYTGNADYPDNSTEKRGYVWATTSLGGKPVRVVATQLPEGGQGQARAADVQQLVDDVAPVHNEANPVIVIGDFNAQPSAPELAPMWKYWHDADPKCVESPDVKGCQGTQLGIPSMRSKASKKKFDYIWLDNRSVSAPAGLVVRPEYTDHSYDYAEVTYSKSTRITEQSCLDITIVTYPCLHTDTLSGDIDVQAQGHGFYVVPSNMFVGSNLAIHDIEWKNWGEPTALGEGYTASTDCNPNCAEGKPIQIQVEIEASTIRPYDGLNIYSCARARKAGQSWDSLGIHGKVCVKTN